MNNWSNIEISHQDPEIMEINKFEESIGDLSEDAQKIRELIRRFEVCHFKYKQHLKHINDSILHLRPNIEPASIGVNHVSKGKDVLNNDKTGRSILGQQYLCSLMTWLGDNPQENTEYFNAELNQQITRWLSDKNQDKERIVRLLVARLMWDWKLYEQYYRGEEDTELAFQVCRMDICHYAFPKHLDLVIQGIGRMEAIDNFEGCGSFTSESKDYVEEQYLILCADLKSNANENNAEKNEKIKIWLVASLAKTLKEQVRLKPPLPALTNY
jgi:hypothetical protein